MLKGALKVSWHLPYHQDTFHVLSAPGLEPGTFNFPAQTELPPPSGQNRDAEFKRRCKFLSVDALTGNALFQGVLGNLTVFLGHAECGTATLADFPQCLSHPCHFHSPKTKVFVCHATVRRLGGWFVSGTPHSLNNTGLGHIPVTDIHHSRPCPTVITYGTTGWIGLT